MNNIKNLKINPFLKCIVLISLYSGSLLFLQWLISFSVKEINFNLIIFSYPISLFILLLFIYKFGKNQIETSEIYSKKSLNVLIITISIIYNRLGYFLSKLFCESSKELNFLLINEINLVFSFILLSPIVEELLFRGIILNGLLNSSKNRIVSVIFTSILFSLIHIKGFGFCNVLNIVDTFIFSIIVSCFYVKTKNVYYAIIFHMVYNLTWYLCRFF